MLRGIVRVISGAVVICLVPACYAAADPLAAVDSFQRHTAGVASFTASIERIQTYRDVRRVGRGDVVFDRVRGCVYTYREPGRYCFISNDSILCGVDIKKRTGWRCSGAQPPPMELREQIDPLYLFLSLGVIDKRTLTYRGNSGEMIFFSLPLEGGKHRTVGFNAVSYQCRIIETFDSAGAIIKKTVFSYGKKTETPFPSAIIVSQPAGDCVSVDSIVFKRIRINGVVAADAFIVPDGVRWGDYGVSTPFQ